MGYGSCGSCTTQCLVSFIILFYFVTVNSLHIFGRFLILVTFFPTFSPKIIFFFKVLILLSTVSLTEIAYVIEA